MVYALMALMAVRELYRHIAKMLGWQTRYRPIRNHAWNAVFAASALCVSLGSLAATPSLIAIGWFACGTALVAGTTVPCGWSLVNARMWLWYPRQLLFLALGTAALARALGAI
ncbi:MAG: hypothetical protein IT406_03665 [Candidatus Yanofskybacteria bacterium]|nr:hypothetical protein [Candidatus Yanofskybacteria bacterium]